MDKLSDKKIAELWKEHFPKRHDDAKSKALCYAFVSMVEDRAPGIIPYGDWSDKLNHACAALGIPRAEFEQVKAESAQT
jgi:hypothetical protein